MLYHFFASDYTIYTIIPPIQDTDLYPMPDFFDEKMDQFMVLDTRIGKEINKLQYTAVEFVFGFRNKEQHQKSSLLQCSAEGNDTLVQGTLFTVHISQIKIYIWGTKFPISKIEWGNVSDTSIQIQIGIKAQRILGLRLQLHIPYYHPLLSM